jgi:hypothetical protein
MRSFKRLMCIDGDDEHHVIQEEKKAKWSHRVGK